MTTIEGRPKREGVAIAVVAVIDSLSGINGVDPVILEEGIKSIRKGLGREDYPEVVVACDNVVMGMSLKIPGVNTIGIAAQADMDVPGLEVEVPCVIGLPNLLDSAGRGGILIVDGYKGLVHIDPDPRLLIQYQRVEQERESRSKLFIASEHIPARTQSGQTIYVYAHITNEGEVEQALDEGADGLLVDLRGTKTDSADYYKALMRAAPGKSLVFAVDFPCPGLVRTAAEFAVPNQVSVMFPTPKFEALLSKMEPALAEVEADPDASGVVVGYIATAADLNMELAAAYHMVMDLRNSTSLDERNIKELSFQVGAWVCDEDGEEALMLIGKRVDAVERMVLAGVSMLAVAPEKVAAAKYKIRSIGSEESA